MTKKSVFWILGFISLLILSQDYLFFSWKNDPTLLGFPIWLYWFALVHFMFIGAFYWFSKSFWRE